MKNVNTDFVKLPKYKLSQISVDEFITRVKKLEGRRLKFLYLKICGEDEILNLKNNTPMMQRLICDAFQKQKCGGLSTRHYNIIYKLALDYDGQNPIKTKDKYAPTTGTILTRKWKQQNHIVSVNDNGFEYQSIYAHPRMYCDHITIKYTGSDADGWGVVMFARVLGDMILD